MKVLREAGVRGSALKEEAVDLWAVVIGLTTLIPGLATDDPESRITGVTTEQVVGILRRHLEAGVARNGVPGPALDATG